MIPVLGDLTPLRRLLADVLRQTPDEVIVVSGRRDDEAAQLCAQHGCRYLETSPNRGAQLHAGAEATRAPVIWFLHADAVTVPDSLEAIATAIAEGAESGCFRFAFQGPATWYKRLLERLVALRVGCGGIAYGDQGLFASREAYFACGGFAPQPLFEEVRLVKRLRARGTFRMLDDPLRVATRRWDRDGWCYRTLHNRWLALRFSLGASPETLAASYRAAGTLSPGTETMNAKLDPAEFTPNGEPRGYIQPHAFRELWFHTGTACNLACPFCLEGSKPGDRRLDRIKLADAAPFIDEAVSLGVEQFSFTGGEPFIVKDFVNILKYATAHRPCLVLTNGTDPVLKRLRQIAELRDRPNPVAFRISIDFPDRDRHDAGRGVGSFDKAWAGLAALHELGFKVSIARQMDETRGLRRGHAVIRIALRASWAAAPYHTGRLSGLSAARCASGRAVRYSALHGRLSNRRHSARVHVRVLEDGNQKERPHAGVRLHARRR